MWWVCSFDIQLQRHTSAPITFPLILALDTFQWRFYWYIPIHVLYIPYCIPKKFPTPKSRQQGPQLEMTIQFQVEDGKAPPHQWIISLLSNTLSSPSLLAQYIALLSGLISFIIYRCRFLQCISKVNASFWIIGVTEDRFWRQLSITQSPPKWTTGSGKMLLISSNTSFTSLQVVSIVTSRAPIYPLGLGQATSLFWGALPQLAACPGVSNYGITLTPLTIAQRTTSLASTVVYLYTWLNDAYSAISGCLSKTRGKESSSVICQWRILYLLYMSASMVQRIRCRGKKCLAESIITPL